MATKKKAANGAGSIRKRTDGRWEGQYVVGYDGGTGKIIRRSVYGKTQKEVRQKLTEVSRSLDIGTYQAPNRITAGAWLDDWVDKYCYALKPRTIGTYKAQIKSRIKPYIGNIQLSDLSNVRVQGYYKTLIQGDKNHAPLSPKSVQNIHGILHKAMEQAVNAQLIHINPCDHVRIPKVEKAELRPLMDEDVIRFLTAIKGNRYERLFFVALFSGLRQSELLGLEWGDVDFGSGEITVQRQLQRDYSSKKYIIVKETKNGKSRVVSIAPSVVATLKSQRIAQTELQLAAGEFWSNPQDFVFTDEMGGHLKHHTVYNHFKSIVRSIDCESTRFHDLRHSYAINALQAGDSPKVVQEQLGHYSSAFTMDTYAEVSKTMRRESQERMEKYIKNATNS